MASPSSSALSYVSTLARPDSSEIDELNFPCAEDASKDSTSRTEVFPVPFAPIITDSGRNASSTSYRRRKPWMKSWPKRTEEWSILFSGPQEQGTVYSVYLLEAVATIAAGNRGRRGRRGLAQARQPTDDKRRTVCPTGGLAVAADHLGAAVEARRVIEAALFLANLRQALQRIGQFRSGAYGELLAQLDDGAVRLVCLAVSFLPHVKQPQIALGDGQFHQASGTPLA